MLIAVRQLILLSHAMRKRDFTFAKTRAQIRCAITAQQIRAFVLVTQTVKFLIFINLKFQDLTVQAGLCPTCSETPRELSCHNRLVDCSLTSHQQLRSYEERILVYSIIQQTGEAQDRTCHPWFTRQVI